MSPDGIGRCRPNLPSAALAACGSMTWLMPVNVTIHASTEPIATAASPPGRAAALAVLIASSCRSQGSQRRVGGRDPSEGAALCLAHRYPGLLEFGEVRAGTIFRHQTTEAAIV